MNKSDGLTVFFLLFVVFTIAFFVTKALSDVGDYKSGLYVKGIQDSESWNN